MQLHLAILRDLLKKPVSARLDSITSVRVCGESEGMLTMKVLKVNCRKVYEKLNLFTRFSITGRRIFILKRTIPFIQRTRHRTTRSSPSPSVCYWADYPRFIRNPRTHGWIPITPLKRRCSPPRVLRTPRLCATDLFITRKTLNFGCKAPSLLCLDCSCASSVSCRTEISKRKM